MTTQYQLWVFHDADGWFLRDFCETVEEARELYRMAYPRGRVSYRIVAVQVCE